MTRRDTLLRHPWASHRRTARCSQKALAALCGVSEQVVLRLEQGLFPNPSQDVMNILSDLCDIDPLILRRQYFKYQEDTRRAFADKFPSYSAARILTPAVADLSVHPLTRYYTSLSLSRIGICKGWCVHPGPLQKYEENRQRLIPGDISAAWQSMGWATGQLREDVDRWRRDYR